MSPPAPLPDLLISELVALALREDLMGYGDVTSTLCVPASRMSKAVARAREPMVVCGHQLARDTARQVDAHLVYEPVAAEGKRVGAGDIIARLSGPARSLFTAERVVLNFLQRLSGTATLTADFVDAVAGTSAVIAATRKTTPGLRAVEKYAVRIGGGQAHRYGLSDGILIKDNHIAAAGGLAAALSAALAGRDHMMKVSVEVDTLDQLREALPLGPDVVLLDNFTLDDLRTAVGLIDGRCVAEASGGVSLNTVRAIAETGVQIISVGALTHSARAVDIGLDVDA